MKRTLVLMLSLAVILLTGCIAPALPTVHASGGVTFSATELLGRPTDTSMTVNVVPSANGQVYFEYSTETGVYTSQTSPAALVSGTPTEVLIQGLTPNTRYYYRMVSSSDGINWAAGDEHSFQTQRSPGSTFTFTITSDSHVNIVLGSATTWQQTMTNVAKDHPDFEIDCGDTFAMDGVTTAAGAEQAYLYQRQFFDIVGDSAPVFLAVGNHEQQEAWHLKDTPTPATSPPVLGVNAEKKYYLNPVPDAFYSGNTDPYSYISGDHLREDYYAWTWGDALFVVIDPYWYTTTKPYTTGGNGENYGGSGNRWDWTLGLQQFIWFNQTLRNTTAKYKFIFAHHMVGGASDYGGRGGAVPANLVEWGGYNVDGTTWGWDTNRPVSQWGSEPIEQIMVDTHVTAFFHGHDHEYAYEKRDGIVYQSLPAAGFSGYGFNSYSVGTYTLKVLPSPGHLRVTVTPTQATVDYVTCAPGQSTNGQVAYTYTIAPNSGNNQPDFSISASPNAVTVPQGGSVNSTITIGSLNGFNSRANLSISGYPSGATCTLSPTSVTPTSTANTFGKTTVGTIADANPLPTLQVSRFQLTENGTVSKLTLYASGQSSPCNVIGVIYSDKTGVPNNLVAYTSITNIAGAAGWYDLVFSTPISLSAGYYHLGFLSGASATLTTYYDAGGTHTWNTGAQQSAPFYPTPPNPFVTEQQNTYTFSIYATYTPPPSEGSATSTLSINAGSAAINTYTLTVTGTSGSLTHSITISLAVTALPATFGKTTVGTIADVNPLPTLQVQRFQLTENGTVSKLTVYVSGQSTSCNIIGVIYADNAGVPTTLVAQTPPTSVAGATGWYDLVFSSPISLSAGYYHLGFLSGASATLTTYYDAGGTHTWNTGAQQMAPFYPMPPNPFIVESQNAYTFSIYATYTPT